MVKVFGGRQKRMDIYFFDSDKDSNYSLHGPNLMHFRNATIQQVYNQSKKKWTNIIEQKTVLPTPYIRLFKDGLYDGRRYFPSCTDEPEAEPQCVPPEKCMDTCTCTSYTSPPKNPILATPTQMEAKLVDDLHIQTTNTIQSTPCHAIQITHQLVPTKLLPRLVDNEDEYEGYQQEEITQDAMIDCDIQEPEDDDMSRMYKSKAAAQISKAIGPQQILKVYDALRTELKLKISEKKKSNHHM